jgi:hybrid cluster-associated redox disulfide protein
MATKTKAGPAKKTAGADAITKDMPIGKIVMEHPETIDVFMKNGLHCIGCAAAHFENLQQGCEAHGIDTAKMVKELNAAVQKK